jgi:DNA-binding PadR family transcriptional regulator
VRARTPAIPPLSSEAALTLKTIHELGGKSDRQTLSKRANLPPQTLSKALSELARKGLAEVSLTYTGEGAKAIYKLTPEGLRAAEEI